MWDKNIRNTFKAIRYKFKYNNNKWGNSLTICTKITSKSLVRILKTKIKEEEETSPKQPRIEGRLRPIVPKILVINQKGQRPIFTAFINGKGIKALIDTGAEASVITEKCLMEEDKEKIVNDSMKLLAANASATQSIG